MGSEGGRGLQGGRYFHVINIHQTIVKILIGQFSLLEQDAYSLFRGMLWSMEA